MKALVLNTTDGYEALYINGILYDEGEPLGEGDNRLYFLKLHEERPSIKSGDISFKDLSERDEGSIDGTWPGALSEFKDKYD